MGTNTDEDLTGKNQKAALVWLILAMVIGLILYLSYYFASMGNKKKESMFYYFIFVENSSSSLRK